MNAVYRGYSRRSQNNLGIGGDDDGDDPDWIWTPNYSDYRNAPASPGKDWLDLLTDLNSIASLQLLFTYLFTILALFFIHKNYHRFIRSRQLFSLELVHSISARTVLVTHIPIHLHSEPRLAEHFENMGLSVESASVCRDVKPLEPLLAERTKALLKLEEAWVDYVGNPSTVESYDPSDFVVAPLIDIDSSGLESQHPRFVVPHRARPTLRPGLFKGVVDAIEYWDARFHDADEEVKKRRKLGKLRATHTAFVTFEKMSSAVGGLSLRAGLLLTCLQQIAIQTAHAQHPNECITHQAPEPRDIIWANMATSIGSGRSRELVVMGMMGALLFFWIFPITGLASLLSYKEIKKTMPWLGRLIDSNDRIRAIVQNSLPSVAMITLNALLPFMLEGKCPGFTVCEPALIPDIAMTYLQGYRARSWIEYSLLKKCVGFTIGLIMNEVSSFPSSQILPVPFRKRYFHILARKYLLAAGPRSCQFASENSREIGRGVATGVGTVSTSSEAMPFGWAHTNRHRHFFLSYVILQGFGIMPLQLLNLGVIIPSAVMRLFVTRTPRGVLIFPSFLMWCQLARRFRRTQRSPHDQLWGSLSSSDSHLCHDASVQCRPATDRHIRSHLLWGCLRGLQVQAPFWLVAITSFAKSPAESSLQCSTSRMNRKAKPGP